MNSLLKLKVQEALRSASRYEMRDVVSLPPPLPLKATSKSISYNHKFRGHWHKPEYDFDEIQIAQDTDTLIFRSIQKKVHKVIVSGYGFTGKSKESRDYLVQRIKEMAIATDKPFTMLLFETFQDLFRYSNCFWVKQRSLDNSSGEEVDLGNGALRAPVAGYFVLPIETLEFKTKKDGSIKRIIQRCNGVETEWAAKDVIHFYTNKKPGFLVGTPEILPALEDVALLRRVEENIEDLIETNLFPVYHYKIGTDNMPERHSPNGTKETDAVRAKLEYMPAHGVYISDHRHTIEAIGSEGKALRIDFYLSYLLNRALIGLGTSGLDLGINGEANKSTAATLSKGLLIDIEAMTIIVKSFLEQYVITELLIEGGYDPFDEEESVEIRFGVIDKEDRRADENQALQMYQGNTITLDEFREMIKISPWEDEYMERTFYKLFEEPNNLLKIAQPGSAASEVLGELPSSNLTPQAVKREKIEAERQKKDELKSKMLGRPSAKGAGSKAKRTTAAKARPSNQHGTRSGPKTNRDFSSLNDLSSYLDKEYKELLDFEGSLASNKIEQFKADIYDMYCKDKSMSIDTLISVMKWRLINGS